jgi:hypothetical protein
MRNTPPIEAPRPSVLLLGCVKLKRETPSRARDLYVSPLWQGRRAYAEASGLPWLILSAEHGLVGPDDPLEPYDRALTQLSAAARRSWGAAVVAQLVHRYDSLGGMTFEVHAGQPYRNAIEPGLTDAGARLVAPLQGLPLGHQVAWYRRYTKR